MRMSLFMPEKSSANIDGPGLKTSKPKTIRQVSLDEDSFFGLLEDVLGKGSSIEFQATGYSMRPAIMNGDHVRLAPLPASGPQAGDIVLFRAGVGVRLHRVIARADSRMVLRGDAPDATPETASVKDAIGRVVSINKSCTNAKNSLNRISSLLFRSLFHRIERVSDKLGSFEGQ